MGGVEPFLDELRAVVGDEAVVVEPDRTASFSTDWTGRFVGSTPAVVRPHTVEQVADILACCNEHRVAVVPQGGNTGLVGGSVPLQGEVVLSLTGLNQVGEVDPATAQVTVGAGVTLSTLQRHAAASGLSFGVDLGARDSATIGGMIATNAGGLHYVRHGGMREQVAGLEAVLANGQVVSHLNGLGKDNTGYDWVHHLVGSEGTLAVVSAARLKLVPALPHRAVALVGFTSTAAAVNAAHVVRHRLSTLTAAELLLQTGLELVCEQFDLAPPLNEPAAAYLLIECGDDEDPIEYLADLIGTLTDVVDAALANDDRCRALWAYRERHTEAIARLGEPIKLDVTLPANRLTEFVDGVETVAARAAPAASVWLFGHVADGNIHVNVTGIDPPVDPIEDAVLNYVAALGGSISAEHGIGTAKARWLHLNRSDAERALFARIKTAYDPQGILNPHTLLNTR